MRECLHMSKYFIGYIFRTFIYDWPDESEKIVCILCVLRLLVGLNFVKVYKLEEFYTVRCILHFSCDQKYI